MASVIVNDPRIQPVTRDASTILQTSGPVINLGGDTTSGGFTQLPPPPIPGTTGLPSFNGGSQFGFTSSTLQQTGINICNARFSPGSLAHSACMAAASLLPGGGSTSSTPEQGENLAPGGSCPPGFEKNANGVCVESGFRGTVERTLPGGQSGTISDVSGEAVVDAFGNPALVPMQVGSITRNDGSVGPLLRCRGGMVLGKNNLCYVKGTLPRALRKWPPAPKPPMTAGDAKALRRISVLQKKAKKLAMASGFSCKKR